MAMSTLLLGKNSPCLGAPRAFSVLSNLAFPELRSPISHLEPYKEPKMRTTVPGPKSKAEIDKLWKLQYSEQVMFCVDYEKSFGNWIVDADGNVLLDAFGQIASVPLGYNHPDIIAKVTHKDNLKYVVNRPALGNLPGEDWYGRLEKSLLKFQPKGMPGAYTFTCGSVSVENALKLAFINLRDRKRRELGQRGYSNEEMQSSMNNSQPGSNEMVALGFHGGFHGRTLGALSVTTSKPIHKIDVPALPFVSTGFPTLQYPLNEFQNENEAECDRCLHNVEQMLSKETHGEKGKVGVVIVEPIQSEGGDRHALPSFFRRLRMLCKERGVIFIVDEVQTGACASGKNWAFEHWDLPEDSPPDIITFSKKMVTGGMFCAEHIRSHQPYQVFNTWMGDPHKLLILEAVAEVVERDNLLELVRVTGDYLLSGLRLMEESYPDLIGRSRGQGTLIAVDVKEGRINDVIREMRNNGVQAHVCGANSLRLRPSLTFGPEHAKIFLERFEVVLDNIRARENQDHQYVQRRAAN